LVLDCCHAAGVVEDCAHLEGPALSRLVAAQCERVQRFEAFPGEAPLDQVVQLFAAAASQNALEDQDLACGLFSGVLADVLEYCAGLDVGWHEVIDEVRMRMRPVDREQAPTLGGRHPRRVPFTERESSFYYDDFACAPRSSGLHLEAGALARITADDCFLVRPLGSPVEDAMPLASVTELSPAHALLSLADRTSLLPTAIPLRAVRTTAPLTPPPSRWQQLAGAVALAPALPDDAIDLRWGRINPHGQPEVRLPPRGATIDPDDDLWLALGVRRNRYAYQLFFAVFHLDPDDRLVSLLPAYPQGLLLACDQHFLLASRLAQGLGHSDTLAWRRQHPPGEHSLIILASNRKLAIDAIVRSGREALDDDLSPQLACYALARLQFAVTDSIS
ncbi:hypothetical protein, partial [Nannocystis pusilla]|uniref:hypothetical protein n=1 Tax=Nannocystis pusilla TaxID=889268 RepID=UPI003BF2600F